MNSRVDDDARRRGAYGTARDWRGDDERRGREQLRRLDEDYEAFRKERYGKFAEQFDAWRANRASQSRAAGPGATTGTGSSAIEGSATEGSGSASLSSRASASSSGAATSGGKESETKQQG